MSVISMAPAERMAFDYADIAVEDAERLRDAAVQIRSWRKQTIRVMIGTGVNLLAAKEMLGHGRFTTWLQAEFGWSDRTARNYIAAAEAFQDKTEIISDLPATVVYQLASPSTPASARDAVVSRLLEDRHVPLTAIRDIVADAKEQDRIARAEAKKTAEQKAKEARSKARREARDIRDAAAMRDWRAEAEARDLARVKAAALIARRLTAEDLAELQGLLEDPGVYISGSHLDQAVRDNASAPTTSAKQEAAAAVVAFEDEFWPAYPRKDDKGRARKAFLSVVKSKKATVDELVNGAMRYAAEREGEDAKFTKQPATWLNAEAWLNERPPAAPRATSSQPASRSHTAMAGILSYGMNQEAPYDDGTVIEG
jgi:hypothetical protein